MSIVYKKNVKQIPNLATLLPRHPSRSVARNGFVDYFFYKQMAFLFHKNYCFFFKTSGYSGECDGLCVQ